MGVEPEGGRVCFSFAETMVLNHERAQTATPALASPLGHGIAEQLDK